jgi:hypothetical protein
MVSGPKLDHGWAVGKLHETVHNLVMSVISFPGLHVVGGSEGE